MLPDWTKKIGKLNSLLLLTIVSTLVSIGISCSLRLSMGTYTGFRSLVYAMVIPLVMTPLFGYFFLNLLFELDEVKNQLTVLSLTDDLTGLYNRRYFLEQAEKELSRSQRYEHEFTLLSFDIDDFKSINDRYGHPAGDRVLSAVAEVCREESRESDVLARLGGDEFAVLIPELGQDCALKFTNRLKKLFSETEISYHGHRFHFTVSMGIVSWTPEITDLEAMLYLLDKALYVSKKNGKNRASVAEPGDFREDSFVNLS